jgi:hypothetical protein
MDSLAGSPALAAYPTNLRQSTRASEKNARTPERELPRATGSPSSPDQIVPAAVNLIPAPELASH